MGGFFLFILIIFFVIFLFRGSLLRLVINYLVRRNTASFSNYQKQAYNSYKDSRQQNQQSSRNDYQREHQKIFSRNEGEYVDFEEIK